MSRATKNLPAADSRTDGADTWRILENLPVPVAIATLEANPRLVFLNKQFTKTFGYTLADMPTQADWARLAYPDENYREEVFARWDEAVARARREKGSVESMEFQVRTKRGEAKDILFHAIILAENIQVTLTDITPRREAERELRTAREKLESTAFEVTENIPAGTYTMVLPPGGAMARFSFMSSRFLELCGLDRRAAEENPFNAFACVHPEDHAEWVRKNAECFGKKVPFSEECRVVVKGATRWILAESVPRELPDGSWVWEVVLTDITRRKVAEMELAAMRHSEREKEAENRAALEKKLRTSLTAAAVAHEINQPLSRILLASRLVLENSRPGSTAGGNLQSHLLELSAEAERVVATIEKMKSLIRNTETAREPLDLRGIVDSALLYAGPFARAAGARLSFTRPARRFGILGDADQLQIALNNLLANAIEAISTLAAGSPREILVEMAACKGRIELLVGDSGPGFLHRETSEVFFNSTKPQGTGLGLFIVQTTMENHGGKIEVGRSPLGGAEFRLVFPRKNPAKPKARKKR